MKRLFGFLFGSEDEKRSDGVKRRRNGSPYVDPDALFEHSGVQKQLQQLDAPLSKMAQDKSEDRREKVTGSCSSPHFCFLSWEASYSVGLPLDFVIAYTGVRDTNCSFWLQQPVRFFWGGLSC
ncbi:MAG: hypothetical protein R6U20_06340 [Longimonas sp.]|uniref:hypothetical protein n=1 Tax=Longimonas sp. TaxID=2039626 RepID=UPI003975E542